MNNQEFGKFISQLRKEKKLTQIQLAEMLNTSDKAISRWENGRNYPDIEMLEALAEALDVSISELLACKRIEAKEEAVEISEKAFVGEVKRGRKTKRILIIIIAVLLAVSIAVTTLLGLKNRDEATYTSSKIDMVSCDIVSILKNIEAQMDIDCSNSDFIATEFDMNFNSKAETEFIYISGRCTDLHRHYAQTLGNDKRLDYCKVYKSIDTFSEMPSGVDINTIIEMMSLVDVAKIDSESKEDSRYSISLTQPAVKLDIAVSELNTACYVLNDGKLQRIDKKDKFKGFYAQFDLFRFNESSVASIYAPTGSQKLYKLLDDYFSAYSKGDFKEMERYCSKGFVDDFFHKNDVFGNKSAWLKEIYNVYYDAESRQWIVELRQGIKPTKLKRKIGFTDEEYLTYKISNNHIINEITTG